MYRFTLIYETEKSESEIELGEIKFNGFFEFKLNDNFDLETWEKIGIIKVDSNRSHKSKDLPDYINARLPINLRKSSSAEKAKYIIDSGLRVPSDSFYFKSLDITS